MRHSKALLSAALIVSAGGFVLLKTDVSQLHAVVGDTVRRAALISAGITSPPASDGSAAHSKSGQAMQESESIPDREDTPPTEGAPSHASEDTPPTEEAPHRTSEDMLSQSESAEEAPPEAAESAARVITQNINSVDDGLDYTAAGTQSGAIYRESYGRSNSSEYITLAGGAQVRNCTEDSNEKLLEASEELPTFRIDVNTAEPQVLIVHTHTTESYEPYVRSYYDSDFPYRSQDSEHNMIAVGEVLAQTLAEHGISVVHDGTTHDHPAYSGAYDRSEATIRAALEQYPSIKVVIDLHRDAIINPDGSRVAPTVQIDGRSAAQLMIISGCDDGRFDMPDYMENYKLACLIQKSTEELYPGLARAVLFDYRNYNQHITTGSLLIEVGGHANSLDEALYTGELLGESLAKALYCIKS